MLGVDRRRATENIAIFAGLPYSVRETNFFRVSWAGLSSFGHQITSSPRKEQFQAAILT
jgi:hypothetical protein